MGRRVHPFFCGVLARNAAEQVTRQSPSAACPYPGKGITSPRKAGVRNDTEKQHPSCPCGERAEQVTRQSPSAACPVPTEGDYFTPEKPGFVMTRRNNTHRVLAGNARSK